MEKSSSVITYVVVLVISVKNQVMEMKVYISNPSSILELYLGSMHEI